jgi:two-component sensor histidine kinase
VLSGCSEGWSQHDQTFPLNQEKLVYAQDTEARALATKDTSLLAEAFYLYGKVYAMAGDYSSSQRHFLSSLQIQERMKDSSKMVRLFTRLSENEALQHHFPEAMIYAKKAVELAPLLQEFKRSGPAYRAMGLVFERLWESDRYGNRPLYDSSWHYYERVYDLSEKEADNVGKAEALLRLGVLKLKNEEREAIGYLQRSVDLNRKEVQLFPGVEAGAYLATAYLKFGDWAEGKKWLEESERFYHANAINDFTIYMLILEGWRDYHIKSGNLQLALDFSERIRKTEREQFLADRSKALERLNRELKADQTEKELELEKERTALLVKSYNLQQLINIILVCVVIGSIMTVFFYYRMYLINRRLSIQNAKLADEQSHRMKNHLQMAANLLSLQSYQIKDAAALAAIEESTLRLQVVALLQKKLYTGKEGDNYSIVDFSAYGREVVNLALDACGYGKVGREIHFSPLEVNTEVALSLALILNELITNACKYAFPGHFSPLLRVEVRKENHKVRLQVKDNGNRFRANAVKEGSSFGMQLIRIQAEQLYATYTFKKDPQSGGACFEMEFSV